MFWFALTSTSLLFILGYAIENQDKQIQIVLIFFAGAGICYTAVAAAFKDSKITNTVHVVGAISGYVIGYLFIISEHSFNSVWVIIPSLLVIWWVKRYFDNNKPGIYEFIDATKGVIDYKPKKIVGVKDHFVWWSEIIGLITIYAGTIL